MNPLQKIGLVGLSALALTSAVAVEGCASKSLRKLVADNTAQLMDAYREDSSAVMTDTLKGYDHYLNFMIRETRRDGFNPDSVKKLVHRFNGVKIGQDSKLYINGIPFSELHTVVVPHLKDYQTREYKKSKGVETYEVR